MVELARQDDTLGWRQVVKRLRPLINSSLTDWRNQHEGRRIDDVQDLHAIVDEAMSSLAPVFLVALAGVESGKPRFNDQRALLDELLNVQDWQYSGAVVIADLPWALAYVYHSLHGAMCMATQQLELALGLAQMKVRKPFDTESMAVWQHHGLTAVIASTPGATLPPQRPGGAGSTTCSVTKRISVRRCRVTTWR